MAQPPPLDSEALAALLDAPTHTEASEAPSEPQSANTFAPRSWAGIVADLAALGHGPAPHTAASQRAMIAAALAARVQAGGALAAGLSNAVSADLAQAVRVMFGFDLLSHISFVRGPREALLAACHVALARRFAAFAQDGFRTLFTRPPVVYLSAALEGHAGFLTTQLGFPRSSVVVVPNSTVGGVVAMDLTVLRSLLEKDTQELRVPLLIAASNGAHSQLDDLAKLASIAAENQLWLHTEGDRVVFQPGEAPPKADSVTFAPGCWLGQPWAPSTLVCAQLDAREVGIAGQSAATSAELLPLWITMRALGLEGATAIIRNAAALLLQAHASFRVLPGIALELPASAPLTDARFVFRGQEGDGEFHVRQINDLVWPAIKASFPDLPACVAATGAGLTCLHFTPFARPEPPVDPECVVAAAAVIAGTLDRVAQAKPLRALIAASLSRHPGLQLSDLELVAAVPVQYVPPYLGDMSEDAGRAELARINRELVPRATTDASAPFDGLGVAVREQAGPDGTVLVAIDTRAEPLTQDDVDSILTCLGAHGHALEDTSMHLDKLSKTLQQGILQAQLALEREQEARLQEEGLLRQVPLVSSVLNWFSPPPPKQVARAGRAFDLSSGTIMQTCAETPGEGDPAAASGAPSQSAASEASTATVPTASAADPPHAEAAPTNQ